MFKTHFEINLEPFGKQRPRFGKKGIVYTPSKTRNFENQVKMFSVKYAPKNAENYKGPVILKCIFEFKRPKSASKKMLYKTTKPDTDNVMKAVKDSLEKVFYYNDSQVFSEISTKIFTDKEPKIRVFINLLNF